MQKFQPFSRKLEKNEFFYLFFQVTRISYLQHFDMTSMPVCTVDAGSLSEITIHNLDKSQKIEICIVPYGRGPGVYLF